MLWSMVSKAAERSRRQIHDKIDNFCDPIALAWYNGSNNLLYEKVGHKVQCFGFRVSAYEFAIQIFEY